MNEHINVNERVTLRSSDMPRIVLIILFPIECFGIGIFLIYLATHFHQFVGQSASIIAWIGWFLGLLAYVLLAWLAVKVVRAAIEVLLVLARGVAEVHGRFIENRASQARIELLETHDNYVVYRQDRKVIVQPVIQERYNYSVRQGIAAPSTEPAGLLADGGGLPTNVLYNDIRGQVPRGHVLVGVGRAGVETKEKAVGACVWIVGLSGTGKTSTTVLRVEERREAGHQFLGVDPHWFKPDSLTNAVAGYASLFLRPMAKTPEQIMAVLHAFLNEFSARKGGRVPKPWQPITLLVDEVNALVDPINEEEEEIARLLPTIARICGEEARNFEMGGIFISQQATGLAWLRKVALMVIVHQLLMQSEKQLACNYDKDVCEAMKSWPIGRTYVYGVGFTDGPRTVQQPYFAAPGGTGADRPAEQDTIVDSTVEPNGDELDGGAELPLDEDIREALEAWRKGATGPRPMQRALGCTYYQAQKLCTLLLEKGLVEPD